MRSLIGVMVTTDLPGVWMVEKTEFRCGVGHLPGPGGHLQPALAAELLLTLRRQDAREGDIVRPAAKCLRHFAGPEEADAYRAAEAEAELDAAAARAIAADMAALAGRHGVLGLSANVVAGGDADGRPTVHAEGKPEIKYRIAVERVRG